MKRSSTILLLVLASIFAIGQGNPIISNYEGARQHYVKKISKRGHLYTHRQTFLDYRGNLSYESLL